MTRQLSNQLDDTNMEKTSALAASLIALVIPLTGAIVQCNSNNRQTEALIHQEKMTTRRELMGMAIGILKEKAPVDKDGNKKEFNKGEQGLRRWAVDILNHYTTNYEPRISPENAENLITGKTNLSNSYTQSEWYIDNYSYESDTIEADTPQKAIELKLPEDTKTSPAQKKNHPVER